MRTRLFHTVVLVGTAMGASLSTVSCGSSDSGGGQCCPTCSCTTFPGISYVGDTGRWDAIATDTHGFDTNTDDTGSDTFPGIHPDAASGDADADSDGDTFPGIAPADAAAG